MYLRFLLFSFLFYTNLNFVNSQIFSNLNAGRNSSPNLGDPRSSRTCRNPFGKPGECKLISQCPQLERILQYTPVDPELIRFLQMSASECGSRLEKVNSGSGDSDEYEEPRACCDLQASNDLKHVLKQEPTSPIVKPKHPVTEYSIAEAAILRNLSLFVSTNQEAQLKEHPNFRLLPHRSICGHGRVPPELPYGKASPFVVGGKNATLGKFPWMALLGVTQVGFDDVQYACGGTVISTRYILTAAHCFEVPEEYKGMVKVSTVRIGEFDTTRSIDCDETECAPPSIDIPVEKVIMHSSYSTDEKRHDIALIRLKSNIKFNRFMSPVCLPLTSMTFDDSERGDPTVAGWGRRRTDSEEGSTILQHVSVPLVAQESCNDFYKGRLRTKDVGTDRFCAGGEMYRNSCQGDSGGPLMMSSNQSSQIYQVGISSLGQDPCAQFGEPAMYTKVSTHLNWILDQLQP